MLLVGWVTDTLALVWQGVWGDSVVIKEESLTILRAYDGKTENHQ